jgi:hypothetical protein
MMSDRKCGFLMRLTLSILVALVVVSASARRVSGQAADDPALRAALHRQEVVKTAYIEFKQVEVIVKGGVTEDTPAMFKPAKSVPDEETTLESRNRFIIDGEKYRYEDNHPTWHLPDGKLKKRSLVAFSNGETAKDFFPQDVSGEGGPVGTIQNGPRQEWVKSFVLTPIRMAFRGDNPAISSYILSEIKSAGRTSFLGRLPCQEYAIDYPNGGRITFLLDPEKDYVVRRARNQNNKGHITDQTDVEYRPHDVAGWVPSSWVFNKYSKAGNTLRTTRVEVVELHVNDPQPDELFDILFPPGTRVHDYKNNKLCVVKSDGSMRELSQ